MSNSVSKKLNAKMIKSGYPVLRFSSAMRCLTIFQRRSQFHQVFQEPKMIKYLLGEKYFKNLENILRKVQNINHPIADFMGLGVYNFIIFKSYSVYHDLLITK